MPSVATDFDSIDHFGSKTSPNTMAIEKETESAENQQDFPSSQVSLDYIVDHVDAFLYADSFFPKLTEQLKISSGYISFSGRRYSDYPDLKQFGKSLKSLSQFVGISHIPIPKILLEQFGEMVQRCEMGIFTPIRRAWLIIDTNVYFWKYDTSSDVAYYDGLSNVIVKVELVNPKNGVFKPHVKYILVVVSLTEIVLLAVTFSDLDNPEDMGDLLVIPEPIHTLPTDNVEMRFIRGTNDGRIFMGGSDGCLYEIQYWPEGSWFSKSCTKVNHSSSTLSFLVPKILKTTRTIPIIQIEIDQSRNILYTLNEAGDIEVFDLGEDGQSTTRVMLKSINMLIREASGAVPDIDVQNFKKVVSIQILEECDSIYLHLVAITKTGVRLYFTTLRAFQETRVPNKRPNGLFLVHIRLPPGFSATANLFQLPQAVHMAYCGRNESIFLSCSNDKDTLWALNSDSFAYRGEMAELYTILPLKTRIWAMAHEKKQVDFKPYSKAGQLKNKPIALEYPSIITQHMEEPKKFIFLTTQGIIIGYKPRLVDQLKILLWDNQGYQNDQVKAFFHLHNTVSFHSNACVFALILACQPYQSGQEKLVEWATEAFFFYGKDTYNINFSGRMIPGNESPGQTGLMNTTPPNNANCAPYVSTPIIGPGGDIGSAGSPLLGTGGGGSLMSPESPFRVSPIGRFRRGIFESPILNTAEDSPSSPLPPAQNIQQLEMLLVNCTNKCRALFMYFSRIIRPIWNLPTGSLKRSHTVDGQKEYIVSNISVDEVNDYLFRLMALSNFIKRNMKISRMESGEWEPVNPTMPRMFHGSASDRNPMLEWNLIYGLSRLIEHCLEVLNLWKLLCIHQFHVVVQSMPKEKQNRLTTMDFKELIVTDTEMTTLLASALVRLFIEDHNTSDIINKRLQDVCPSIYRNENAMHAKVHEMILRSKSIENEHDRKVLLDNALNFCHKIGKRINLSAVCELFQSVRGYDAIVEICLSTAHKRDPHDWAMQHYKNRDNDGPKTEDDVRAEEAYDARIECYRLLLDVYWRLVQQSKSLLVPGHGSTGDIAPIMPDQAKIYADQMFHLMSNCKDELFHYTLYNWLCDHNQTDRLLEIKSPYLESYLKDVSERNDNVSLMDLMWLYYERNGKFAAAAHILARLAENENIDITLQKRIEYLSRAIVCINCQLETQDSIEASENIVPKYLEVKSHEYLQDLDEKIQIARIQLQVLESIEKLRPPHYEDAVKVLNSILLPISSLYKEFVEPYRLYECQLKILHYVGHDDAILIESVWNFLLESELAKVLKQDPQIQEIMLKSKIIELCTIYHKEEKFFPLDLIVNFLEKETSQLDSFGTYWLAEALLEVKVPLIDLLYVYNSAYIASVCQDPLHILSVLIYLVNQLPNCQMTSTDRRYFANRALDLISGYISDLAFKTSDDSMSKTQVIMNELQKIRKYLEKLL